jgi:hypothetical protein
VTGTKADRLRKHLTYVSERSKIAEGLEPLAVIGESRANETWLKDEVKSGRADMRDAHRYAGQGLEALALGNEEFADTLAWSAIKFYVRALERQLRPEAWHALGTTAKRRGRPVGSRSWYKKSGEGGF